MRRWKGETPTSSCGYKRVSQCYKWQDEMGKEDMLVRFFYFFLISCKSLDSRRLHRLKGEKKKVIAHKYSYLKRSPYLYMYISTYTYIYTYNHYYLSINNYLIDK